jgi:hypothetical protein
LVKETFFFIIFANVIKLFAEVIVLKRLVKFFFGDNFVWTDNQAFVWLFDERMYFLFLMISFRLIFF